VFESRWAEGQIQRLPQLIDDVAAAQPEVIYVLSSAAAVAAKKANLRIPVVVPALSRHGGNITGVTYSVPETAGNCSRSCATYGRRYGVSVLYGRRASPVSSPRLHS
jgi:hypothetical protein